MRLSLAVVLSSEITVSAAIGSTGWFQTIWKSFCGKRGGHDSNRQTEDIVSLWGKGGEDVVTDEKADQISSCSPVAVALSGLVGVQVVGGNFQTNARATLVNEGGDVEVRISTASTAKETDKVIKTRWGECETACFAGGIYTLLFSPYNHPECLAFSPKSFDITPMATIHARLLIVNCHFFDKVSIDTGSSRN